MRSDAQSDERAKEPRPSSQGAALVIVLVLLTMVFLLPLAFFLQNSVQQKVSNASTTISLEATLAEGAIETIMSDLAQEIASTNCSSPSTNVVTNLITSMVYTNLIYYPFTSSNATPALAGSSGANGLENLIKRSAAGVSNYLGATCWAVASSSTNASANGIIIPIARWNKHLLIARANPNSTTDTTPTNSFTAPDWIYVARDGTTKTTWSNSLCWSATNTSTVVGRYAYAMYDEGGLLDANVAGYPTSLDSIATSPVTGKNGTYFADLHQIGLTDKQINALVGWRNYASALASNDFPTYTFPDSGSNYAQSVIGNDNGFMETFNTNVTGANNTRTDHQFSGRQQLIALLKASDPNNVASGMNALRYLGNFSRELSQPSYAPSSNRPTVGTNDNSVNPPFLSISVNIKPFQRNTAEMANVGDALIKYRFPLNLLSWITYAGPSSTALASTNSTYASLRSAYTNASIPQSLLDYGTTYNISHYFGLTWNTNGTTNGSWTYRSGSNQPIMTLSQVSAASREPDFFELLKAAITYGSLGKSYSTSTNATTPEGYNATLDNWTDAQIIQIGANMIDQFDADSYPTRIQFSDGSTFRGAAVEIRGVEDLPYLYRVREGKVMTANSTPSVISLPMITNTASWSSTNGGSGVVLQEPEIWNPHAMRSSSNANPGPTNFQLLAISTDPLTAATNGNQPTINYTIGAVWEGNSGALLTWTTNTSTNLNTNNSKLAFNIPTTRQDLFREPTLLIKPGIPTNSNLAGSSTYVLGPTNIFAGAYQYAAVGVTDSRQYLGIPMGIVPMALAVTFNKSDIDDKVPNNSSVGLAPTGYVTYQTNGSYGYPAVTYLLQCQDVNGNWITYDEKYTYVANATNGYGIPNTGTTTNLPAFQYNDNKTFYVDSNHTNWSKNAIGSEWSVVAFDPRSSRFGMLFAGANGGTSASDTIPLGAALAGSIAVTQTPLYTNGWAAPLGTAVTNAVKQNALLTIRPDVYAGLTLSSLNTGPTTSGWRPTNGLMRPGMFPQNNPNITSSPAWRFNNDPQAPAFTQQFFADDDNVVRRGMSAFVPYSGSYPAVSPSSTNPSGLPHPPAYSFDSSGNASAITNGVNANEYLGRPIILNRPFRSVAELGYVFSGTPWRNLDFSTPESGTAALLDIFCMNDTSDSLALIAGKVNLNTRQVPVLQAILAGAYKEEFNTTNPLVNSLITTNLAKDMAQAVVLRTQGTNASAGPFLNVSELVGKWYSSNAVSGTSFVNGSSSYVGFTDDQTGSLTNDITAVLSNSGDGTDPEVRVQRLRDATIRALSSSGQTRVWNVLIDLFAQPGRFPKSASGFGNFMVDGEIHYWIHLSIDRLTGKLLDRRVETVKE